MTFVKNIRLYIDSDLILSCPCELNAKASHYLCNVMRCKEGDVISCFNERNGEFLSKIIKIDKKNSLIEPQQLIKNNENIPDLWILFAPLKKDNTDFVIEKATELGVTKIIPVITQFTNTEKIKDERLLSQAIEAAEQCERLSVPKIEKISKLKDILNNWDNNRTIFFMNERKGTQKIAEAFCKNRNKYAAILVGPEGGFSEEEKKFIETFPFVESVSMGPRILRAETAVISALSVWQSCNGDWI